MTTYSKNFCTHQTLVASTVDTVDLAGGYGVVLVTNRGANDIYCTFGKGGGSASAPTVGGDDCYIVQVGTAKPFDFSGDSPSSQINEVKLISSGTPAYSVESF